jgi:hypothetical protein
VLEGSSDPVAGILGLCVVSFSYGSQSFPTMIVL